MLAKTATTKGECYGLLSITWEKMGVQLGMMVV